jgi:hypothetical protein
MAYVTAKGLATPFDPNGQVYPAFGNQVPALRSFHLADDWKLSTHSYDQEIHRIEVLVGGPSQDQSPTAELNPSDIPDGRLEVSLWDDDPEDETFSYEVSHSLLDAPGVRRFQFRDVGCVNHCVQKLPIPSFGTGPRSFFPPIIALVGFKLYFIGGEEHELRQIGIWFRDNDLHVVMRDDDGGDTFGYLVDFLVIPTGPFVNISSGVQKGKARGKETFSIPGPPNTDFLLTGWNFNFIGDDHDIKHLGVVRSNDDVTVYFSDKDADDRFIWRVEWAHFGPLVASPT